MMDAPLWNKSNIRLRLLDEADVIVFVVSGRGRCGQMQMVCFSSFIRQTNQLFWLSIKLITPEMRNDIYDFYSLGLGDPYPVSSVHGIGTGDVLDAIIENLPAQEARRKSRYYQVQL